VVLYLTFLPLPENQKPLQKFLQPLAEVLNWGLKLREGAGKTVVLLTRPIFLLT